MSTAVLLDSGPLGVLSNPKSTVATVTSRQRLAALRRAGWRIIVPEIADYEVRRELLRVKSQRGLANLDQLSIQLDYLPLTTAAVRRATELWAQARQQGQQTASNHSLDADVLLAAQALTLGAASVVIGTFNVAHLSRYVPAELWDNITP